MTGEREVLHLDTMEELLDYLALLNLAGCTGLFLEFDSLLEVAP